MIEVKVSTPGPQGPPGPPSTVPGPPGPPGSPGINKAYVDARSPRIHTGTGVPTEADGETGEYYLAYDRQILYGPKNTTMTLFTDEVPETEGADELPHLVTMGILIGVASAGRITHVRDYRPHVATSDIPNSPLWLWTQDGSLIETWSPAEVEVGGWYDVPLTTPLQVVAGQTLYLAKSYSPGLVAMAFTGKKQKESATAITNGGLTLEGVFGYPGEGAFPDFTEDFTGEIVYKPGFFAFLDVRFEATWPLALANTQVLTSFGPPSAVTGLPGDMCIDLDQRILYGPKATGPRKSEFFDTGDQTDEYNMHDQGITTGYVLNEFRTEPGATVTHLRYYRPASADPAVTSTVLSVWSTEEGHLLMGTATTSNESAEGWYTAEVDYPIEVSNRYEGRFLVGYAIPENGYVAGTGMFDEEYLEYTVGEERGSLVWHGSLYAEGFALPEPPDFLPVFPDPWGIWGRLRVDVRVEVNWPIAMYGASHDGWLSLSGGTMSGILTLAGSPSNANDAVNKAYSDLKLPRAGGTLTGLLTTLASAAGTAGIRLPHGVAPTTPVDGDVWTTSSGLFVRINGVTKQVNLT